LLAFWTVNASDAARHAHATTKEHFDETILTIIGRLYVLVKDVVIRDNATQSADIVDDDACGFVLASVVGDVKTRFA
jgi:hypothetical protein